MSPCTSRKIEGEGLRMPEIIFSEHTLLMRISLAAPLLLFALGGSVCSKAGNFNIALECSC